MPRRTCGRSGVHVTPQAFLGHAMANPTNAALLSRLPSLGLNQCFLTAGCLFQAAWNRLSDCPVEQGVNDYDVFYFDDQDLSWGAEDKAIQCVNAVSADLGAKVETRNQARVHLWYKARFGREYLKLASTREGIDRYLVSCTCVGIEVASGGLYAPNGLADLERGILRPNPLSGQPALFQRKAQSYQARWPWLTIA